MKNRELMWTVDSKLTDEPFTNFDTLRLTKSCKDKRKFVIQSVENSNQNLDNNPEVTLTETDTRNLLLHTKFHGSTSVTHTKQVEVSCVSYIDDAQRIILFTQDESLADIERSKEASSMEIFVALKGMQVSLINNVNLEIASISIKDSKAAWELNAPSGDIKV